jgi:SAM-dependent methyltransferase
MRPPRFLLRELTVRELIAGFPKGRFLEVGYGAGYLLETLAKLGYEGVGFDPSADARQAAEEHLREQGISGVRLVDRLPEGERFELVFLMEVIGYLGDPVHELSRYRELLQPTGKLVLSFNGLNADYAHEVQADQKSFSPRQIREILAAAGYVDPVFWNYGFPLVNLMRPGLNAYHRLRARRGVEARAEAGVTGLRHRAPLVHALSRVLNEHTIRPFALVQRAFRHTELGNGFVVACSPG